MSISRRLKCAAPLLMVLLSGAGNQESGPHYAADGALILPADYREWVFLSSGIDMSYSDEPSTSGGSQFDNVFVDPAAWAVFKSSGHWPDKTVFVMENRVADSTGSINKHGHYQTTELRGLEFHIRDESRFKGGWAFFFAPDSASAAALIPAAAPCYACHQAHGAVDTTFTQFYPTAKILALKAHTYREQ
jgi:Cytochrome P460